MFTVSSLHHPLLYFKLAPSLSSTSGPEGSLAVAALVDAALVHQPQSLVLQSPSLDQYLAQVRSQLEEVGPRPSLLLTSSRGLCLATQHPVITLMEVALLSVALCPESGCPAGDGQSSAVGVQVRNDGLRTSGSQQEMHLGKE